MKIFLRKLADFDEKFLFLKRIQRELIEAVWIPWTKGRVFGPTKCFLEEFS